MLEQQVHEGTDQKIIIFVLEEEEINTRGNSLCAVVFIITLKKKVINNSTSV